MEGQKANRQLPIWKEDHREQPARHGGARGGGESSAGIHPRTIPVELVIRPVARETRQHANGQSNRLSQTTWPSRVPSGGTKRPPPRSTRC